MSYTFGKAEKTDFPKINELFREMLRTIYRTDQVNGYPDDALDRFFDGRDEWICVARDKEQIIAFLSIEVHHEAEEYLYLDDFSVAAKYRNHGIGTQMLRIAEDFAAQIRIPAICLHVEKSNAAALRLYERRGYRIKEDQGSRYLMAKEIPTA